MVRANGLRQIEVPERARGFGGATNIHVGSIEMLVDDLERRFATWLADPAIQYPLAADGVAEALGATPTATIVWNPSTRRDHAGGGCRA